MLRALTHAKSSLEKAGVKVVDWAGWKTMEILELIVSQLHAESLSVNELTEPGDVIFSGWRENYQRSCRRVRRAYARGR